MELLFVTVIAAGIGLAARYVTGAPARAREQYGVLLTPALSASVAAAVWAALLWLGFTFDGTWIWVASLGAATLAGFAAAIVLPRLRTAADERLRARLRI